MAESEKKGPNDAKGLFPPEQDGDRPHRPGEAEAAGPPTAKPDDPARPEAGAGPAPPGQPAADGAPNAFQGVGDPLVAPPGRIARIERDPAGQIVVHMDGRDQPAIDAKVARCFPWSLPARYVSILDKDGKQIALLETLDGLDGPSRRVVEGELAAKVFHPIIRRVISHKHEFGMTSITADTDRGVVTFQVRTRDDVYTLSPTRALFRDADGNIYEVQDLWRLDAASRKRLEQYF